MRVLVVNAYFRNNQAPRFAAWVKKTGAVWVLGSEMQAVWGALSASGLRVFHGDGTPGAREVGIATRRRLALRWRNKRLTDAIPGVGVAHDRHYTRVRRGRNVFYSLHANAAIQDRDGGWEVWKPAQVWRQAMRDLAADINGDRARGLRPVVGGDFNWRKMRGSDVAGSPEWLAEFCGLKYVTTELMWLLHDPYWRAEYDVLNDVPTNDHSPHPALLVDLRRR